MKIGLVCPYDLNRGGGVQEHVLAQAQLLRARGHIVKIITPRPRAYKGRAPKDTLFVGNSTKVRTPIKTTLELGGSLGSDTVDTMLAREKFDLIHIHEPEVPILGAQIVAKASVPVVATFHAIFPETPMAWTIEAFRIPYSRSIFSRLSAITAVSDIAAGFVRERTDQSVTIIPNGIDLTKYRIAPKKSPTRLLKKNKTSPQKILYIGRLEKRKGVKYLLKAFELLAAHYPHLELHIAGMGPEEEKLKDFVRFRDVPNVHFHGFVSDKKKRQLLSEATVFCTPALFGESFGIVLLEAMAMGVVTLAGDNPGYAAVLKDVEDISLVNPKDTHLFATKLDIILNDETVRKRWRQWAAQTIQAYDYNLIVDSYEEVYKRVTS